MLKCQKYIAIITTLMQSISRKDVLLWQPPQKQIYTEIDYYTLPEDVRAELIDGQIYYQAAPSRIHQKILGKIHQKIANYIDLKAGLCEVYPSPFAVKLWEERTIIVEPDISVICDPNKLTERYLHRSADWIIRIISRKLQPLTMSES